VKLVRHFVQVATTDSATKESIIRLLQLGDFGDDRVGAQLKVEAEWLPRLAGSGIRSAYFSNSLRVRVTLWTVSIFCLSSRACALSMLKLSAISHSEMTGSSRSNRRSICAPEPFCVTDSRYETPAADFEADVFQAQGARCSRTCKEAIRRCLHDLASYP